MTETKRDLRADLAICSAATSGPWYYLAGCIYEPDGRYLFSEDEGAGSTEDFSFVAEARTGWPIAIERAISAEKENEMLWECAYEMLGNVAVLDAENDGLYAALREIDTHIRATSDPIPHIVTTLKRVLPEYAEEVGDPFADEEKCPCCRGVGSVGGLRDGDEYIPVEDCYSCGGSGVRGTQESAS